MLVFCGFVIWSSDDVRQVPDLLMLYMKNKQIAMKEAFMLGPLHQ